MIAVGARVTAAASGPAVPMTVLRITDGIATCMIGGDITVEHPIEALTPLSPGVRPRVTVGDTMLLEGEKVEIVAVDYEHGMVEYRPPDGGWGYTGIENVTRVPGAGRPRIETELTDRTAFRLTADERGWVLWRSQELARTTGRYVSEGSVIRELIQDAMKRRGK